jgi:phage terminase large subunit
MDSPDKFLSSEFDYIYVNQAEELDKHSWELLTGRATGRAGNTTEPMVFGDCNPGPPWHWILERMSSGDLVMFEQLHEHNPVLFNQSTGEITEQGRATMAVLDSLTGIRYERGRLGRWVASEGIVYDNFSIDGNVTIDAEYRPDIQEVYWGVDDGYAHGGGIGTPGHHPRAVVLAQIMPNGFINIFDEYYETLKLPEETITELLERPYQRPELTMVDSSAAELRRRLIDADLANMGATHRVADGIKNMRRFILDGNGVRMLRIHPRCVNLIREMQTYRYDPKSKQADAGEPKPEKLNDHAVDACRYLLHFWRWE